MSDVIKAEHLPIYRLEEKMKAFPQIDIPVDHQFCHGVYARTITIPAGTLLTGAVHKDECFFLVRSGSILLTTDGEPVKAETGFMVMSKAESKRVGFAIEETVVTTFHANPLEIKEPQELWEHLTIPAPDNLLEILDSEKLEGKCHL